MRCIGARERCAWATICTICDSTVAEPTRSERITSAPLVLSVAPISLSPGRLVTGSGSPVSIDSSTALAPSVTTPSTGIFSPGRTRSRSPTCTCASGTSCSLPSGSIRRAVFGASPSKDLIAAEVCERALSSRIWPSRVSEMMTAAASKYTATRPMEMKRCRKDLRRDGRHHAVDERRAGAERRSASTYWGCGSRSTARRERRRASRPTARRARPAPARPSSAWPCRTSPANGRTSPAR